MSPCTYLPCPECRKINRISFESLERLKKQPQCGACKSPIYLTGMIGELNASGLMALSEKSPMPVVATFWSPRSKESEGFSSAFFQAGEYFAGEIVFVRVNAGEHTLAPEAFGIRALPTTLFFSGGFERGRLPYPVEPEELLGWIQTLLVANRASP